MRIYFRLISGDLHSGLSHKKDGLFLLLIRYLFTIPLFTAVLLFIRYPHLVSWSYYRLPLYLRTTGIILGFFSLYGLYRVHRELGQYFSSNLSIREGHRLIQTGPYSLVRHPMYTSYLLLFLGAFLMTESWVIGLSGGGVIGTLMTLRIKREEALLLEHFGEEYEEYRERTGMFIPLPRKRHRSNSAVIRLI